MLTNQQSLDQPSKMDAKTTRTQLIFSSQPRQIHNI
jgi:hypothetical protein